VKRAYVFLMLALGSSGAGCGRQDLDLLVQVQKDDPCLDFTTEGDCRKNTALGCSYQPNAEGCRTSDPSCQPGMCRSGDPFVRRAARSFLLNGQHFRFAGVSSWALLQPGSCGSVKANERVAWIERAYDELVPARAKVARTFAFQSSAGPSGDDFTLFDASVRAARRAGIRLQLVLENVEGGCSQGMRRDDAWYTSGYQTPDGSYALSYRAFAEAVATRYRDEPTVLGYVLMQSFGGASPSALASFATEMGQRLHGIAPSQLLSLDLEWGSLPDDGGATYLQLQDLPEVDFVDVDDYTLMYPPKPQDPTLLQTLAKIDKPAIIGEGAFGLLAADDAALAMRADEAKQRVAQWYEEGFSGALLWAYQPGWGPVSEEFDARPADPMLQPGGVLASAPW
jgi:mannan endo-1,4-beta-mannosidase